MCVCVCNVCICIPVQLVSQQRSRLGGLWDALKMGEQERALYEAFEQQPTDLNQALHLHDAEIRALRQRERETAPLLARIEEYSTLVRERDALKETTADASRLMARKTNSYVFRQVDCLWVGACVWDVYIHTYMHAYILTYLLTYIHTYIHTPTAIWWDRRSSGSLLSAIGSCPSASARCCVTSATGRCVTSESCVCVPNHVGVAMHL